MDDSVLHNLVMSGGGNTVYAPTGGSYITWAADTALGAQKTLTAGANVTITTDGSTITIAAAAGEGGGSTLPFRAFPIVAGNAVVWTNMPAAGTVLFGNSSSYAYLNLNNATSVRWTATTVVAGSAPANFVIQASTNGGSTWQYFATSGTGTAVNIGALGARTSAWLNYNTALSSREILVRVVGSLGNGALDPSFGHIGLQAC